MARPSSFTQKTADIICERLIDGESLRAICDDANIPTKTTVLRWLGDEKYSNFRDQYARAREIQADMIVDEILEISDNAKNDWMDRQGEENQGAGYVLNGEHVQRSRLRVDSRKWMAGKLFPKRYGDKTAVEHSGTVSVALAGRIEAARKRT